MRKFAAFFLMAAMLLSLTACGASYDMDMLTDSIVGTTWTGSTKVTNTVDSTQGGKSEYSRENEYTVVFDSEGTCTAYHVSTNTFDDKWDVKAQRGKTIKSEHEYECSWSMKTSGKKVILTLSCTEFMGMVPHSYTLTLDEGGNILSVSGTNGVNDPIEFTISE